MADLTLRPQIAPSDRVRVWLGIFEITEVPVLRWTVNGQAAHPTELRTLESARSGDWVGDGTPRAFTGVYEFDGLAPDQRVTIECRAGRESARLTVKALPAEVPRRLDEAFHLMLVSCFHVDEDRTGLAGARVQRIPGVSHVDATLFLGDQVYLDLPTLANYRDDEAWMAARFERYYRKNLSGTEGFNRILQLAPGVCSPDDHEYWNNFPHRSPIIQNSWTSGGRQRWKRVASRLFEAFQQAGGSPPGAATIFDVDPLSVFVADTRTDRDEDLGFVMPPQARQTLADWVERVNDEDRFGVFVSGQSMLGEPVGGVRGRVADWELANYGDYEEIVAILSRLRNDAMLITGDVHWGRVVRCRAADHTIYEVISSPTSLVTTVGSDTVSRVGGWFRGLFSRDPIHWPRHSDPDEPPRLFAQDALRPMRYETEVLHRQKGNHVVVLSFRHAGDRLEVRPTYMPIHREIRGVDRAPTFSLARRPARVPVPLV